MEFEKHLFISYAHLDNAPLSEQQQGWITRFHANLTAMLSMRIGRPAQVWRDSKLRGNDRFESEILSQFPKTALFISVLTPRYVESEWCTREVREFCNTAEQFGGLIVDNKSRVLKVIKFPVESEAPLPAVMKEALGYPFYTFDQEQTPIDLDPLFGAELGEKYHVKLAKLAWDITQLLQKLKSSNGERGNVSKPYIYLAECSYDRREAREALEGELRLHGYTILPDRQLPRDESTYAAEVAALLEKSKLSIHLVGSSLGAVPDGPSQKSVVMLQNELAVSRSRSGQLKRIIWLPEGTTSPQVEQQRFIELLHTNAEAQREADLLTADFETLKAAVHATLETLQRPISSTARQPDPASCRDDRSRLVYLICNEKERAATVPMRKFLRSQGVDVKIPLFEGDAATVRQANEDILSECDAVILFYGLGNEVWKRTIESELRKRSGVRRERPLRAVYTYLADPSTPDKKELVELEEPDLIDGLEGFSETQMQSFLEGWKECDAK